MISVFRHVKPFSLITLVGSILISYGYLKSTGISDPATMFQTVFGGKPLNEILLKSLFVMIVLLLQVTLIDYIAFYVDNSDNLLVRYGNKNAWLKALLKGALMITAAFVILFYLIALLFDIVSNDFKGFQTINMNTVEVIARVYLFCVIIAFAQVYLLLKFTKANTFMIMVSILIFLALTNHYQDAFFYILPRSSSPMTTILHVLESIVLVIVLVVLIQRNMITKELSFHED
ncbi:hypothetical protein M6D81_06230 [Paenibacillus sp. J5C_2022]|uniref:hypothetical protein n=1 Tax=Paenibacillus sp. J5C2022 TaxID=2977129 RepID=UPI0021CF69D7|nr:hypothetical protein [Paenibacillus sp. J5C2022]MCU6708307.1 hypothetical protein [Paenibacillus sp. J5C2022]